MAGERLIVTRPTKDEMRFRGRQRWIKVARLHCDDCLARRYYDLTGMRRVGIGEYICWATRGVKRNCSEW